MIRSCAAALMFCTVCSCSELLVLPCGVVVRLCTRAGTQKVTHTDVKIQVSTKKH